MAISQQITRKEEPHVITSREGIPTQTSNGLGRGMDQSYWHLLPSIKTSGGLIGI